MPADPLELDTDALPDEGDAIGLPAGAAVDDDVDDPGTEAPEEEE